MNHDKSVHMWQDQTQGKDPHKLSILITIPAPLILTEYLVNFIMASEW